MHSYIMQLSKSKINPEDYVTPETYQDDLCSFISDERSTFIGRVADYVSDEDVKEELITALKKNEDTLFNFIEDDKIKINDKTVFFENKYEAFQETCQIVADISKEDFCNNSNKVETLLYLLEETFHSQCGIYIDIKDGFFGTMDDFLRMAKNGDEYYIGAVLDYHA